MNKWLVLILVPLSFLGILSWANAPVFEKALPGYQFHFPGDHASHPHYKTEWWYYTGHLKTVQGKQYGYELTFFRVGTHLTSLPQTSAWALNNVYLAHFAISDEQTGQLLYSEKLNRAGVGLAGADTKAYRVWNQNWSVNTQGGIHHLKAGNAQRGIQLSLTSKKSPIVHGLNGVSQKGSCLGCASHYYSLTRLNTQGQLWLKGRAIAVQGMSWMDHEFGSNQLGPKQAGWDWFSLQLDNGQDVMLYLMRNQDGTVDSHSSGTLISSTGGVTHLKAQDFSIIAKRFWKSLHSGGRYPMDWEISIPSAQLVLKVTPAFDDQELMTRQTGVTYWEGSSRVSGTISRRSVRGNAYVEMTGYNQRFHQKI